MLRSERCELLLGCFDVGTATSAEMNDGSFLEAGEAQW